LQANDHRWPRSTVFTTCFDVAVADEVHLI
jgi:hypothetical protein